MTLHVVFSVPHIQIGTWRNPKVTPAIDLIHDIYNLCTHRRTDGIKAISLAFSRGKQVIKVVYHLQKVSGKSGWKVNGSRHFGSLLRKTSGCNGTSEKAVLFFRTDCSYQKCVFLFVDTQFQAFAAFFPQMVNSIP